MEKIIDDFIEKGRAEGKAEVIRNMLDDGLSFDKIAKFTGFTVDEISIIAKKDS